VADRTNRERLADAVLMTVHYNGGRLCKKHEHYKGEKGMTVMTPRTTTPGRRV